VTVAKGIKNSDIPLTSEGIPMAKYKPVDYSQSELIPVCLEDQLIPGTLEYAIHYLIENRIDTSCFARFYTNDETGCPAFDPKVMLKAILLSYSRGIFRSRQIERLCRDNVVFMALTGGQSPDHSTIARFIARMDMQIIAIFNDVLLICQEEGLLGGTEFALDGCKISSNASKGMSGTFKQLKAKRDHLEQKLKEMLKEHKKSDVQDENHSVTPRNKPRSVQKRLDEIKQKIDKLDTFLDSNKPKLGHNDKEIKSNVTDNDSAQMLTPHGVRQGYNAQALVDSKYQVIVHAEAIGHGQDDENVAPMIDGAKANFAAIGQSQNIFAGAILLADAGYHSESNLKKCCDENIDAYIPDINYRKRDPRHSEESMFSIADFEYDAAMDHYVCPNKKILRKRLNATKARKGHVKLYQAQKEDCTSCPLRTRCLLNEFSTRRQLRLSTDDQVLQFNINIYNKLATPEGQAVFSKRQAIVEPVFANITFQKRLDWFSLRSKLKVDIQWRLFCLVHNIEKLLHFGSAHAFRLANA
jgi:transposase